MSSLTALFSFLLIFGAAILYPITPKYFQNTKKFWLTSGTLLSHIGLYGLLWMNSPWMVSISLFLLESGLFIMADPIKIIPVNQKKIFIGIGTILTSSSIALSLSFFTHFPLWLWAIPTSLYLLQFIIPPVKKHSRLILALSVLLIVSYLAIIGFRIYSYFHNDITTSSVELTAPNTPPVTTSSSAIISPVLQTGPIATAIKEADSKLVELEAENKMLKEQLEILKNKQSELEKSLSEKLNELNQNSQRIDDVKKAVGQ